MSEETTIVVEGEAASKLLDCFVAYKKIIGASELPDSLVQADNVEIGALPTTEEQIVESKASSKR